MIYFVRCPRFGLVKIGYAKNVPKRIREVALPALVDYFEFDQEIGGIRATDRPLAHG